MPPLCVQAPDNLAGIMFDVFSTQRSKQLLQRQRDRIGSPVEVAHFHCRPPFVHLLHYSAVRLWLDPHPINVRIFRPEVAQMPLAS